MADGWRPPIIFNLVDEPFYTSAGVEAGRFTGELEFAVWDDDIRELNASSDALEFHDEPIDVSDAFSPIKRREYPPMPTSEDEWRAHCAFYRLTVDQRDRAWRQIEDLKRDLDKKKETPSG